MIIGVDGWIAIIVGVTTLLGVCAATVTIVLVFISQLNAQRAELRVEQRSDVTELRGALESLRVELAGGVATLAERTDANFATLADRINTAGTRVTQVELEQARQSAAQDILLHQTHTHASDN